jgi:hypothetical protein
MINSRQKGARGEREFVAELNLIIAAVLASQVWSIEIADAVQKCIQRNQNQSAVGGCDLVNTFGLAFEIKRVEQLHIEMWWEQTTSQARRNDEHPVLAYRQNKQQWSVMTIGSLPLPGGRDSLQRLEMNFAAFKVWFYQWVYYKMMAGEIPRV